MIPSTPFGAFVRRWSSTRPFCPLGAEGHRTDTFISVPVGTGSGDVTLIIASPIATPCEQADATLPADAGPQQVGVLGQGQVRRHEGSWPSATSQRTSSAQAMIDSPRWAVGGPRGGAGTANRASQC